MTPVVLYSSSRLGKIGIQILSVDVSQYVENNRISEVWQTATIYHVWYAHAQRKTTMAILKTFGILFMTA